MDSADGTRRDSAGSDRVSLDSAGKDSADGTCPGQCGDGQGEGDSVGKYSADGARRDSAGPDGMSGTRPDEIASGFRVVVVEDDRYLREELLHTFRKAGCDAAAPDSFASAEAEILSLRPDIVVLDVNLPGKSGYELCRSLKARSSFPILILTARDTLADELTAFGLGADDFLTKPCHPNRLLARTKRLLQTWHRLRPVLTAGPLSLDTDTYRLACGGRTLLLSETEGRILRLLMEHYPGIVEKGELFSAVWGTEEYVDENILRVNMSRLRKSLAEIGPGGAVRNVRGKGYVLEVDE